MDKILNFVVEYWKFLGFKPKEPSE